MAIILIIGILTGASLLVYGVFFLKGSENESSDANPASLTILKQTVEDADATLTNINSVSSLIIEEIDIKYKELLFLYQMMDVKKKEILSQVPPAVNVDYDDYNYSEFNNPIYAKTNSMTPPAQSAVETNFTVFDYERTDASKQFPQLGVKASIIDMYQRGYDVTTIARELSMGKGEVQLIISLNNVGVNNV